MNTITYNFDVIIVGGGHAGIEAAYAAARMGSQTLLITLDVEKIGTMPCNPAIGGVGKGHIVFELSALGGLMPQLCTKTYLQARMLNTSRGPAVHGLRLQIDKYKYNELAKTALQQTENLTLANGMVQNILTDGQKNITGVVTRDGIAYTAPAVVFTTGTFLNGTIHIGETNYPAGRRDEESVTKLSHILETDCNLRMGRLKTGTPPRLLASSVDFSKMQFQQPDNLNHLFEFHPHKVESSHACYITRTNVATHKIIKENLHRSAMYSGSIVGVGPRYCPSIEDKIGRFPDKDSHQIFVEPESESCGELYPNGISTSLPLEIQKQFIQTIQGFEQAIISKAGYAIEYDYVMPDQLKYTLETKSINGLFLAGQINGTTGYEEAAGQGIIAGINAHLKVQKKDPFILSRNESYIGVMIDDLVSLGVDEPYRMFTSRAERRLLLRQDNAFLRLSDKSYNLGLITKSLYNDIQQEKEIIHQTVQSLRSGKNNTDLLKILGNDQSCKLELNKLTDNTLSERTLNTVWADIRYEPYIKREVKEIEKTEKYQKLKLSEHLNYRELPGLSKELQEKLCKYKPTTIAQASLIRGMTPAAISVLILHTNKRSKNIEK